MTETSKTILSILAGHADLSSVSLPFDPALYPPESVEQAAREYQDTCSVRVARGPDDQQLLHLDFDRGRAPTRHLLGGLLNRLLIITSQITAETSASSHAK